VRLTEHARDVAVAAIERRQLPADAAADQLLDARVQ